MKTRMVKLGFGVVIISLALLMAYWAVSFTFGETGPDDAPAKFDAYAVGFLMLSLAVAGALATLGASVFIPAVWERAKSFSLFVLSGGFLCAAASRFALLRLDDIYILIGYFSGAVSVFLSCVVIVVLALSPPRPNSEPSQVFRFIHVAVAVHVAVSVLSLQWEATKLQWFADLATMLIWTETAAGLTLLAFLNRRRPLSPFAISGAAASAFAFVGMLVQAPAVYAIPVPYGLGWRLSAQGWHAAISVAIPLLAFTAVFLRNAQPLGGLLRFPKTIAAIALMAVVCAGAVQTFSAPCCELSREMNAAISASGDEIRLSDLTDFEWDTVEIHTGLSSKKLSPLGYSGINLLDRMTYGANEETGMFLFVKDGKPVYMEALTWDTAYVEYRYNVHAPSRPDFINPIILKREDVTFALEYNRTESKPTLTVKDLAALMY